MKKKKKKDYNKQFRREKQKNYRRPRQNCLPNMDDFRKIIYTLSLERKKNSIIKGKIDNLKYNDDQDINIFTATLQNYLDEMENIDHGINDNIKAGILNRSLPENLRIINVFRSNIKIIGLNYAITSKT